jgi:hypothetical protein
MIMHKYTTARGLLGLTALAVALALGSVAGVVAADVPAGPGAGAGAWHPGHGGDSLVMALHQVKSQLNLNTSQEAQWASAMALSKSAHSQDRALYQGVKTLSDTELAKSAPDLAAVAAAKDDAQAKMLSLHQSVRDAWLNVYASLTPDQKATEATAMRADVAQRQARMDAMRAARTAQ